MLSVTLLWSCATCSKHCCLLFSYKQLRLKLIFEFVFIFPVPVCRPVSAKKVLLAEGRVWPSEAEMIPSHARSSVTKRNLPIFTRQPACSTAMHSTMTAFILEELDCGLF